MQIELDGKIYEVPESYVQKLAENLWVILEGMYEKMIPDSAKVGMMALTRAMLAKAELEVRMAKGKEAARAMRPPTLTDGKKTDPNLWIMRQYLPQLKKELEDATIICETSGESITNFMVATKNSGETGRQVDIAGGVGLWQNDGLKIS